MTANDIKECSLFFRATYVNTYCLPLLFYFVPAFELDEGSAKRIEKIIWRFVWRGKIEKLSMKMLFVPRVKGGIGVVNYRNVCQPLFWRNAIEMLQRDDEIGCLERDWLLPVLNEVGEEQVLTLVEEVPDQLKETAET